MKLCSTSYLTQFAFFSFSSSRKSMAQKSVHVDWPLEFHYSRQDSSSFLFMDISYSINGHLLIYINVPPIS